jgi:ureidoglycolate hydrolase
MISKNLLEIRDYAGEGYRPLIDYGAWRVAVLRYIDELLPENIGKLQRHDETDEVFVLLSGRCLLFIADRPDQADRDDRVGEIHAQDMQPLKLYNIKRGTWHTHTLDEQATVLIIENRDTGPSNSPEIELETAQRARLIQLTQQTWTSHT